MIESCLGHEDGGVRASCQSENCSTYIVQMSGCAGLAGYNRHMLHTTATYPPYINTYSHPQTQTHTHPHVHPPPITYVVIDKTIGQFPHM